ncbi:MAG TPA: twin-arginine translocase subunit TatC [Candidatus Angelobacter sp.]|jgi:sec-independent protein translocase protein TatC|nr:twin-arginine translocase subunit TatC [Candidatus Angelobacter sp.]
MSHIEVLRKHIIRSLFSLFLGMTAVMLNKELFFDKIILAPAKSKFVTYRFFRMIDKGKKNFILPEDLHLQNRRLFGQFNAYIGVCLTGGIILSFPYIMYEFWRFIKPGLSKKEKSFFLKIFITTSLLFLFGILFGYFVLSPMTIQFAYVFKVSPILKNVFDLSDYVNTIIQSTLSMGLTFLLPIFVYFFTKIGLINQNFLRTYRKHAFLVILIISAALTPGDALNMFLAAIPILLLYELSINVSYN